jgi:acetyl esterase/lipase
MRRFAPAGFGLFLLLSLPPLLPAQGPKLPDGVELLRDVEYGKGGERALKLHILRPKEQPKAAMPVVVWIHGGGWEKGNKDSGIALLAPFADRGYFCASVEYRLSAEAIFPAQIEDCKCAIRFLRSKAKEYNLNPERIGVWGGSAGGHLVALLGLTPDAKELEGKGGNAGVSSRVQAVCDYFGPSDLVKIVGDSDGATNPVVRLLGGKVSEKKDLAIQASPIAHVGKGAPPFLIMHGDEDKLVPLNQSEILRDALQKAGCDVTLRVVKGAGHGFGNQNAACAKMVAEFFDKHLKK